jgi:hypothetical protein
MQWSPYLQDSNVQLPNTSSSILLSAGLVNQGATCFMNAVLQMWFHVPAFRELILACPDSSLTPIHNALRSLFTQMKTSHTAFAIYPLSFSAPFLSLHFLFLFASCSTVEFTRALGWGPRETSTQQDAPNFAMTCLGKLRKELKDTSYRGAISMLMRGFELARIDALQPDVDYHDAVWEPFYERQFGLSFPPLLFMSWSFILFLSSASRLRAFQILKLLSDGLSHLRTSSIVMELSAVTMASAMPVGSAFCCSLFFVFFHFFLLVNAICPSPACSAAQSSSLEVGPAQRGNGKR